MTMFVGYGCLICGKEFWVEQQFKEHLCKEEDIKRWRNLTQKEAGLVKEGNNWIKGQ